MPAQGHRGTSPAKGWQLPELCASAGLRNPSWDRSASVPVALSSAAARAVCWVLQKLAALCGLPWVALVLSSKVCWPRCLLFSDTFSWAGAAEDCAAAHGAVVCWLSSGTTVLPALARALLAGLGMPREQQVEMWAARRAGQTALW